MFNEHANFSSVSSIKKNKQGKPKSKMNASLRCLFIISISFSRASDCGFHLNTWGQIISKLSKISCNNTSWFFCSLIIFHCELPTTCQSKLRSRLWHASKVWKGVSPLQLLTFERISKAVSLSVAATLSRAPTT